MNFKAKVKERLLIVFVVLVLPFFIMSCSRKTDSSGEGSRPVITVGSEDYPPFTDLDNNGDPTGLDMDILREAFDRIGYDIRFVEISWEDKDMLLSSGEVACVTGGFTMESRENDYLWVGPYLTSNQVVAVNTTLDIQTLGDLEGRTVAVQAASIGEEILLEHSNPDIPGNIQVLSYEDNSLPFAALGCDYVDAIVADEPAVIQYMKDYNTVFTILDEPVMKASIGTAFPKDGDVELCRKLNDAIETMREDGTLDSIIRGYLGDPKRGQGGESEK